MDLMSTMQFEQELDICFIRAHLDGVSITGSKLYIKTPKGPILTYAGALDAAKLLGIKRKFVTIKKSRLSWEEGTRKGLFNATCTVQMGDTSRTGAAQHSEEKIAIELAFRNAVKQIVIGVDSPDTRDSIRNLERDLIKEKQNGNL